MEYTSDSFVNYTETTVPPNESFPDIDFMLQSPVTDTSGVPSYTHETSSLMYNQSVSNHSFGSPYASPEEQRTTKVQRRRQKAMNPESTYGIEENNERNLTDLSHDSKKIQKRNKAKQRARMKQNMAQIMAVAPEKYIPSGIDDPNLDDKTKRKMIQMAKNRMAAQKTRDRKRQYTSELEEVKDHLNKVNDELAEKNRLLEERIKALEVSQMYLVQENQELKKNQFMEAFNQSSVDYNPSSIADRNTGFDSNDEYKSMPSPALVRGPSRSHNNYWNFFLGIIAICAVYTGINIKIGQETENVPDLLKTGIDEWVIHSDIGAKEEPTIAETVSVKSVRGPQDSTYTTMGYAPREGSQDERLPIAMMAPISIDGDTIASDEISYDDGEPMAMHAASLTMESRVYQPMTMVKSKWEYIYEILTLHRGFCYKWDDPNYMSDYGETTILVSHEDFINQEMADLNVNNSTDSTLEQINNDDDVGPKIGRALNFGRIASNFGEVNQNEKLTIQAV